MDTLVSKGLVIAVLLLALVACKRGSPSSQEVPTAAPAGPTGLGLSPGAPATVIGPKTGDRIQVRWKGTCYAAKILKVAAGPSYFITYEGYDHSWDETITPARLCH